MLRSVMTSQQVFALTEDSAASGVAQAPTFASTHRQLIKKPPGEVGRPGRNGYSLEETLEWGKDLYSMIQVIVVSKAIDVTNKLTHI